MLKSEIKKKAKEFFNKHNVHTLPVDIVRICNSEGFKVFEEYLPHGISGYIVTDKENIEKYETNKVIIVNLADNPRRRRFTIAHELAHYALHKKENEDLYAHRDSGQNNSIEREADIFASNILMPEELLRDEISKLESTVFGKLSLSQKISCIADAFAVSESAAAIRLKELAL